MPRKGRRRSRKRSGIGVTVVMHCRTHYYADRYALCRPPRRDGHYLVWESAGLRIRDMYCPICGLPPDIHLHILREAFPPPRRGVRSTPAMRVMADNPAALTNQKEEPQA